MYDLINAADRTFIWIFAKACADFEDAAFHLIRISQVITKSEQVDLLSSVCEDEMKSVASLGTMFRLNSLATKMMDTYLKQEAAAYLLSTLESPICEIIKEDRECEIDPSKIATCDAALLEIRHDLLASKYPSPYT
jgi:hypothetical protein